MCFHFGFSRKILTNIRCVAQYYSLISTLRAGRVRQGEDYNKAIVDRETITENGGKDQCADDGLCFLLRLILMEKVVKSYLLGWIMLTLVGYAMSFGPGKRSFAGEKRWFAGAKLSFGGSKRKNSLLVDVAH